jgi:single-strand DNA-binding protein
MNLNKAMIIGNLTRDPELRNTPGGVAVATFSVATNYVYTDQSGQKQDKAEFHNIVTWRRLAEISAQYLKRGSKVFIEGRMQTRDWLGQDGVKRYRTEIVAENMIMLDRPSAASSPAPIPAEPPVQNIESTVDPDYNEEEIKVENIPF